MDAHGVIVTVGSGHLGVQTYPTFVRRTMYARMRFCKLHSGALSLSAVAIALLAPAVHATPTTQTAIDPVGAQFFESKIRPLLVENCYKCHSADAALKKKLKGGLYLDTREGLLKGGENGPAIVAGKPEQSRLITAVRWADGDLKMPPKKQLPESAVADLEKWIAMGAPDPRDGATPISTVAASDIEAGRKFWAFQPFNRSEPPAISDTTWGRTPIDGFILARLETKKIRPNGAASKRVLIRRAYFDLIGLPPSPEQVRAFVDDSSPDAWEKVIDSLLSNPAYGERWARHWLDVARFAESDGYEFDADRPTAWPYRDFVIRAFNQDMPYDQFVRWQLAGDEAAPDDPQALAATGFLSAGVFPTQLTEREFESARYDQLDDMVSTTGVAFMGMTIGCARCHDHKFDPIGTLDYYRFAASFTTAVPCEVLIDTSADPEKGAKMRITSEGLPPVKCNADERGYPHFYPNVYLLRRGDPGNKIEPVTQSFLRVLMAGGHDEGFWKAAAPSGARTSFRRSTLANWMTDPENGAGQLAARVIVNRIWQHHFGTGIVATPNDFGAQGDRPTHPELLDWLARDLIDHSWKLKRIHKLIMTSSVYMESAESSEERRSVDPHDQLLWRWQPRRLEAEPIRDAMLCVSGLLDTAMYGHGTLEESSRRRSIYFTVKRSRLIPMMMVLDWPEPLNSIGARPVTTVAPQALLFMNSPQARQYSDALASRVKSPEISESIAGAYQLCFQRPPTQEETRAAVRFTRLQADGYRASAQHDPEKTALADFCQALLSANEFVYVQ